MPRRRLVQLVVLFIVFGVFAADAASPPSFPPPPPPGQFVSDGAGLITPADRASIERIAAALLAERGYPIAVVTVRSLEEHGADDYPIERYAAELLRSWPAERNFAANGMLLLVAADDHTARIQLGSVWGNAHDERARRVMDRLILPAFRQSQLSTGLLQGVHGFDAMGRQLPLPAAGQPGWVPSVLAPEGLDGPWWTLLALVGGGIAGAVVLGSVARGGRKSWGWAVAAFVVGLVLARLLGRSEASEEAEGGATGQW